jgi:7,8-dihydro-6-hydroxymethylpterin dimethyltransferase
MKTAAMPAKKTYSICPVCLERIPAKLVLRDDCWYMEKSCEQHGKYKTVVWRGSAPGLSEWGNYNPPNESERDLPNCPSDCGLCDKHLQSTCCVLVEVTDRCNLRCPVCFAQSGDQELKPEKNVDELFADFEFLVKKGCKFIQLSGGEPTVRDDLPEIISAAKRAGATSVQLNSNGVRLGKEPAFTKRIAEAGLDFVFMQFDGLDDEIYRTLRGRDLLEEKLAAIKVCGENGIGVTLVPTIVPDVNVDQIGAIIKFGLKNSPAVRGVHFQPISYFGRYPEPPQDESRFTLPEIVAAIEQQTEGMIRQTDLAPSSCDHPRCGFHGDFVITQDKLVSLMPKVSTAAASDCCCKPAQEALRNRNFVARRWKRNLSLESQAMKLTETYDTDETMDFDSFLAKIAANGFTVTSMAFQDAYNLDMERLRRCSLHVYDDGRIVPFCAKYLTSI